MILKTISKYITLIIFILSQVLWAQDRPMEDYSLAKKVNVSNNYNTGQPNIVVPLYNLEANGLKLSASLNYGNDLVIGEPSIFGTNWNSNLFGKIILKAPFSYLSPIAGKQNNGFYTGNSNTCLVEEKNANLTKKQMLDNPNALIDGYYPNQYYFEFLGYHGSFLSDNVGNIIVQSDNENFKVTFNGNKCYNIYSPINSVLPEIVMEDSKGNKFYFGGDYNSVDVNYDKNKYIYSNMYDNGSVFQVTEYTAYRNVNYLNAFYLKKVELNNGRTIEAYYRNSNKSVLDNFTNGGYYFGNDYSFVFPSKATLTSNNLFLGKDKINNNNSINYWTTSTTDGFSDNKIDSYQKIAILDSIKISDYGSVNFSYEQINNDLTKPFLKNIKVKNKYKLVNDINLNYEIKEGRVFLESIADNLEKYFFGYYDYLHTQSRVTSMGGLLKKITHPTKGFDEIEYERNKISKVTGVDPNGNPFVTEIQDTETIGHRLKSLKTFTNDASNFLEKKYSYINANGKSSGIAPAKRAASIGSSTDPMAMFGNNGSYYNTLYGSDVAYSKVTEEIANKEKNEYYFSDAVTNSDSLASHLFSSYTQNLIVLMSRIQLSKSVERGKLYLTKKYDANNTLVFEETIKYKNFLNNSNPKKEISPDCTDCRITDDRFYIRANKHVDPLNINKYYGYYSVQPLTPYLPVRISTKQLASDNVTFLESTKNIDYNDKYLYWHSNPTKISTNVNGRISTVYNYYPGDLLKTGGCYTSNCNFANLPNPGRKMLTYKQMVDDNIITPILTLSKNNFNKYSLSENIFEKVGTSNRYRLTSERTNEMNSVFNNTNFENAEVFETRKYEVYDSKNNLIQSTPKSGIPTTTIWGYHQTKPIAKIEGATYAQVMQAFNLDPNNNDAYLQLPIVIKSDSDVNDATESELLTELNNFRTHSSLKDFQVSTYTFDPLIGIKSITPLSGIKESYKYDTFNRLERILNVDDNILKEYKYNYAPRKFYSPALSEVFYKNDCLSWMVGQPYTYSIPEKKYVSTISQADANQMAQNDMNVNAQNAANLYGGCGFITCDFTPNYYISMYHTSIQQTAPNHIKIIMTFKPTSPPSGMTYDNGSGMSVGYIGAACRPSTHKSINYSTGSSSWTVNIDPSGYVMVKLNSGSAPSPNSPFGFSVEYDK